MSLLFVKREKSWIFLKRDLEKTMATVNPFITAADAGINVHLLCSLERPEGPREVSLDGRLQASENRTWLFTAEKCVLLDGTCRRASQQAKYSFRIPGEGAGTGVSGEADVLKVIDDASGEIAALSLRFGSVPVMRALRRHPRYSWKAEFTRLAAVFMPNRPPATKEALRAALREHVSHNPRPPLILDIAAGGGRICLPEDQVARSFAPDCVYVIFFVPNKLQPGEQPYAFLARHLGRCAQSCPTGVAMRFAFLAEMDWTSTASCHWVNIASQGSNRLKECLERYSEDTYVQD